MISQPEMCFVTNDLPKEIYCLLPRRHIIHLEVQGKFSFIPFPPLQRIWASSADRWLPFALPEIWPFKEGGCWPPALDGSVDHPFCSASCRERGCCQHWRALSVVQGRLKSWGLQNQCPVGALSDFACCVWADLKAGKGDLVTSYLHHPQMHRQLTEPIWIHGSLLQKF